jgi:hypothetical protein
VIYSAKMSTEEITLRMIEMQTVAAFVAAIAALAMWKATVSLVKVTRDMLLANVPPEIFICLEHAQPFATKDRANAKIENRGSVDLTDVHVKVGGWFHSDDDTGQASIMYKYDIGNLKSRKSYKFPLWDISKGAIRQQKGLDDTYRKARDADSAPVEVHVTFRQGGTGIVHTFKHCFLVHFDPEGNLQVSELFIVGDSRTIKTTEANTISERTITPIPDETP